MFWLIAFLLFLGATGGLLVVLLPLLRPVPPIKLSCTRVGPEIVDCEVSGTVRGGYFSDGSIRLKELSGGGIYKQLHHGSTRFGKSKTYIAFKVWVDVNLAPKGQKEQQYARITFGKTTAFGAAEAAVSEVNEFATNAGIRSLEVNLPGLIPWQKQVALISSIVAGVVLALISLSRLLRSRVKFLVQVDLRNREVTVTRKAFLRGRVFVQQVIGVSGAEVEAGAGDRLALLGMLWTKSGGRVVLEDGEGNRHPLTQFLPRIKEHERLCLRLRDLLGVGALSAPSGIADGGETGLVKLEPQKGKSRPFLGACVGFLSGAAVLAVVFHSLDPKDWRQQGASVFT